MKLTNVFYVMSVLAATAACATEFDPNDETVIEETSRQVVVGEETPQNDDAQFVETMDTDTDRLNAKVAAEKADPEWQAQVRERFHGRWKALNPDRAEPTFTQDFTCSSNLCAARIELSDANDNRHVQYIIHDDRPAADGRLWGRTSTRPEHGDDLQVWIFLWRPGASRL